MSGFGGLVLIQIRNRHAVALLLVNILSACGEKPCEYELKIEKVKYCIPKRNVNFLIRPSKTQWDDGLLLKGNLYIKNNNDKFYTVYNSKYFNNDQIFSSSTNHTPDKQLNVYKIDANVMVYHRAKNVEAQCAPDIGVSAISCVRYFRIGKYIFEYRLSKDNIRNIEKEDRNIVNMVTSWVRLN